MKWTTSSFNTMVGILSLGLALIAAVVNAAVTAPPYDPSPFLASGYITGMTLKNPDDPVSGGTITFDGITVIIPDNLLVNTPSLTAVSWPELFNSDGSPNLPLWPQVNWEVQMYANFIGGQYVAGIVYIFQELGHLSQGFITNIDYATGEMRVGGDFNNPASGVRVVINDPVGRFGLVHGDWPLWTADTENPSVLASTGFPMCVPRVDPATGADDLCPIKNRPTDAQGNFKTIFTFGAPPVADGQPDPNVLVPFVVGDYITFSATQVTADADPLYAAYTIETNLGIFTAPGTKPAYIRIAELQDGVNGDPDGEIAETRVIGYATDNTVTIRVLALDVDPCTGEETERTWGTVVPKQDDPRNKWLFRSKDATTLAPFTREVRVRIAAGSVENANGLLAGEYTSPQTPIGWIFPELTTFGDPMFPLDFSLFPWLAKGSGPWLGGVPGQPPAASGPVVGPLNPWPGLGTVTPTTCAPPTDPTPQAPVANAGGDLTVKGGDTVTLSGKSDVPADNVTFSWVQTDGPSVNLTGADTASASFVAPTVTAATAFAFNFTATNDLGSSSDNVVVTVTPNVTDAITITSVSYRNQRGTGHLTVQALTNNLNAKLSVSATNPNVALTPMNSLGGGSWQVEVSVKPKPDSVTVVSDFGGSASASVP